MLFISGQRTNSRVTAITILAVYYLIGCAKDPPLPQDKSIGETPENEQLRLPYYLTYVTVNQLHIYEFTSKSKDHDEEILLMVEPELQLNLVRMLYLRQQRQVHQRSLKQFAFFG